jgi:hypothetical protein
LRRDTKKDETQEVTIRTVAARELHGLFERVPSPCYKRFRNMGAKYLRFVVDEKKREI